VELIGLIREELLKSAELTGIWEKKLREIEKKTYKAGQFLEELKQMVTEVVQAVMADNSNRRITILTLEEAKKTSKPKAITKAKSASRNSERMKDLSSTLPSDDSIIGKPCPICGKGQIIKGNTAYGCSEWRNGCTFRLTFLEK
jgi:DNA topoisomerase-3